MSIDIQDQLLATKFYHPRVRPTFVLRPRLVRRLNEGLDRKLTLISAPAGFGKTTLLGEWIVDCKCPFTWLSLDERDNDLTRFLVYLIKAIRKIQEDFGESALSWLLSQAPSPMDMVLTGIINEIAEIPAPFTLVLDDFHEITDQAVHEALMYLVDNQPPNLHMIIASRADPPWPLARLRAGNFMVEVRANDLRFTLEEITAFLNDTMRLNLSAEDLQAMEEKTEGWIAGLQMAALTMQHRKDITSYIRSFTGSNRFIFDYLVEEVLHEQTPEIQEFLIKTSVLGQLSAPLCDALLEIENSQDILMWLDQGNLFLVPLDDERLYYRYHRLFADLLRGRLKQTYPDQVKDLHLKASDWFHERGMIIEAGTHARAAGDLDQLAHLIEENAMKIADLVDTTTLINWLEALPDGYLQMRPWLSAMYAFVLSNNLQLDRVGALLKDAERALEESPLMGYHPSHPKQFNGSDTKENREEIEIHLRGFIAVIRSYHAALSGDISLTNKFAREALAQLPADNAKLRGIGAVMLGASLILEGDLEGAELALSEAVAASQASNDIHVALDAHGDRANLLTLRAQLPEAEASCVEAIDLALRYFPKRELQPVGLGYVYSRLSAILLRRGDYAGSLEYARRSVEISHRWDHTPSLRFGYVNLAYALQALGDESGALEAMGEAVAISEALSPFWAAYAAAHKTSLLIAQAKLDSASRWAQDRALSVEDDIDYKSQGIYHTLAEFLFAQGWKLMDRSLEESVELTDRLLEIINGVGVSDYEIKMLSIKALALFGISKRDRSRKMEEDAVNTLVQAIEMAEPAGYVHSFTRHGEPMGELLRKVVARGEKIDYASKLLSELQGRKVERGEEGRTPASPLVEPLSKRELEVLRYLVTNLPTREIADEMYISVSTVRSHIKSIYAKLDVHQRLEAVQKAKELALV